jgi:hypothetical protein
MQTVIIPPLMIRWLIFAFAGLFIAGVAVFFANRHPKPIAAIGRLTTTQPASQPTVKHAAKPKYPTYMELVRKQNPSVAATQPLDSPLEISDSAHLVLHDPVFMDSTGNLWITRADGQPTAKALVKPAESEDHVIQDRPIFVHWSLDDTGNWAAAVVVRGKGAGYDIITKTNRRHLADDRHYKWETAFSILGKIVVTTEVGVSVFDIEPKIQEHYHAVPGCSDKTNPIVTMLDTRGVLAWSAWENNRAGSSGICRFVDGGWLDLPASDWPNRPIQLSMLLDGSILRMAAGVLPSTAPSEDIVSTQVPDQFPDQVHLTIGQLEHSQLDEKHVTDLINQLSDSDSDQRQAAFDELSRYGPELAPLLEKAGDDQLPGAKLRIRQLLRNKITPALGGLILVDNRLDILKRCADGTVIFFAPAGVQMPTENGDDPELINPAWLALRADGRMERPLPPALIRDQKPDACTLFSIHDEWIVNDEAGPRRLAGNRFEPLLLPEQRRFRKLIGIGSHRRWIFQSSDGDTLIIDPLIADPTPKLPAWTIAIPKGIVGWDTQNLPAVSRSDDAGNWELQAEGWKALTPPDKVLDELPPGTEPSTTSTLGNALLTAANGTKYFDGKTSLIVIRKTGTRIVWPLPASAVGSSDPTLVQTSDGLLFLFNQPGRLLRIRPTSTETEPFKLEAIFTKDIPNSDHPSRIWLDPAGRIDFVSDRNVLTVTFPSGIIPKEISRMMLDDHK